MLTIHNLKVNKCISIIIPTKTTHQTLLPLTPCRFQTDPLTSGRWVESGESKYKDQLWTFTDEGSAFQGDSYLEVATQHKHYGLSRMLDTPYQVSKHGLVMQYEVRFKAGFGCSGAYVKMLSEKIQPEELKEDSAYSVMFGPDRCGNTNKVHLIFRVQNPVDKTWEEKVGLGFCIIYIYSICTNSSLCVLLLLYLYYFSICILALLQVYTYPSNARHTHKILLTLTPNQHLHKAVAAKIDEFSHLYRVEVKTDNTYKIQIDGETQAEGSLFTDFTPAFEPLEEINDPLDTKPSTWVDEEKIADPQATKPEDWDEDAPATIPDPEAQQPEFWDEEDDGEWEAPLVPNPAYKGKWKPGLVDNPAYKGVWTPRKVANPAYHQVNNPIDLVQDINGLAFEILANEKQIAFDNVGLTMDVEAADALMQRMFAQKAKLEKVRMDRLNRLVGLESGTVRGVSEYYIGEAVQWMSENAAVSATSVLLLVSFFSILCVSEGGLVRMLRW